MRKAKIKYKDIEVDIIHIALPTYCAKTRLTENGDFIFDNTGYWYPLEYYSEDEKISELYKEYVSGENITLLSNGSIFELSDSSIDENRIYFKRCVII